MVHCDLIVLHKPGGLRESVRSKLCHSVSVRLLTICVFCVGVSFASPKWAQAKGNVELTVQDGTLIVTGDERENNIIVIRACCDKVLVTGRAETTVNGNAGRVDVEGVTRDIAVRLRGGDDFLRVEMVSGAPALAKDLRIHAGNGDDIIELMGVAVQDSTVLDLGDGSDIVFIDGVLNPNEYVRPDFRGRFSLDAGNGDDLLEFHHALFRGAIDVSMGSGIDGVCNTEDSEFQNFDAARFDGGPPTGFPGDGFVAPIIYFTHLTGFENFPDDCAYLGGRD